jgi:HSP20 family protein
VDLWFESKPINGRFNEAVNRFFADANGFNRPVVPAADVVEDADGYLFNVEMAGLDAGSVDVRAEDEWLVIEAERKRPELSKESEVHLAERRYGKLRRAFRLADDASHEGIRASYRDGVLEIRVPKRPESKPVKIAVEH